MTFTPHANTKYYSYCQDMIAVEPDAKKDTKIDREHEKESRSESKKR